MAEPWSNWSGSVRCAPQERAAPGSEAEIAEHVRRAARAGRGVRVVGAGHSFVPLVATKGMLLSLEAFQGIEACDPAAREARIRAGTWLRDLNGPLRAQGLAFENLGDVDVQALGGALATGTHGTGRSLANLSSRVSGLRLVTADGEILECSEDRDPDLLRAARVSLGALGVVSTVRLRLVPAQCLHERIVRMPVEECLDGLAEGVASNRHYEFFWYPSRDRTEVKTLNPTDALPDDLPDRRGERIGWSGDVLPSVRDIRFNEMEYSVPAEAGPSCFGELRERILAKFPDVVFPVEYRTLAADDAWLSPAFERDAVTLSVHRDAAKPFQGLFADVESILRAHAGRPHWGKLHRCGAAELAGLYPRWERFRALRQRLDPKGVFLNAYLRELFG